MRWKSDVIITACTVALFIGKKGTGKSTRRKAALASAMGPKKRVISFDPLDEDSQLGRERDSVVLGPLTQRMTTDELADNIDVLWEPTLALAVVPMTMDPQEWARDFTALLEDLQEPGDATISAAELAVWSKHCAAAIDNAACLSRHWGELGCGLLFDSQRATGIPFTTRTQASDILSSLQDMPEDLEALGDRCGRRFADEVAACRGYEHRHWRDTDGRWERNVTNKPGRTRKEKNP